MKKKQLLSSAPWRDGEDNSAKFEDAKLRATNQPGSTPTMYVPRKKKTVQGRNDDDDSSLTEIDPELRYSFQRNFKVISSLTLYDDDSNYALLFWIICRVTYELLVLVMTQV